MKLSKQLKTKLDLVRLEGLCKLIFSSYDEKEIISKISRVTQTEPRDAKALYNLSRSQLIKIIENSNIDEQEIEKCYEEYRYGLKPGFSIYSFKSSVNISYSTVKTKIIEELKKIECIQDEQPCVRNLKFNNMDKFEELNLCEYSFYYSKKHSYIDEKEEPTYIYELKETFVWISTKYRFIAIKNCDEKIAKMLSNVFSNIYCAELNHIILTKELIKKIFGDKRKKVAGVNPNANENEAEKIIISDPNLDKKEELTKQLEAYTTTSENLDITISEKSNTLGVNNEKGKLHLTKNMTATVFRTWSVDTIKKIIEFISNNETSFEIFKAKNIMSSNYWSEYAGDISVLIEEIVFKLNSYFSNKDTYNPLINSKINFSKIINKGCFGKCFINCLECNDQYCIPKCDCGSYDIRINNKNEVFCGSCGEKITYVECEEGHKIDVKNADNINIFLIPEIDLYDKIINFVKQEYNIDFNGSILVLNNGIYIKEKSKGKLLKVEEIKELNDVYQMNVNETEKEELLKRLKNIKEKCTYPTKEKCNMCNKNSEDCCILQLFTTFNGYRPGPHHGHEFGDVNFKVEYLGKEQELVGIIKSYCDKFTHASQPGREMIQQIISSTQDKRVGIIAAICPTRFDTQLEKDIEYIAKCTQSKIVVLDDRFMMKQLKSYKIKNNEE